MAKMRCGIVGRDLMVRVVERDISSALRDPHVARWISPACRCVASSTFFDLDAGAVTITLPDPGPRFMSMVIVDEDYYVRAVYYGNPSWDQGWIGSRAREDSTQGGVR